MTEAIDLRTRGHKQIELLVQRLAKTVTPPGLYNMYTEEACALNLLTYLKAIYDLELPVPMVVGEAAGPHGCRLTGVAFTSESVLFGSERYLLPAELSDLEFARIKGRDQHPYEQEFSATRVWSSLQQFSVPLLLWNCVPFHPYRVGEPLSIRSPRKADKQLGYPFLEEVIATLKPSQLIPVGRKAEEALNRIGVAHLGYVRHPSRGGAARFAGQMNDLSNQLKEA